jgi:hypothetical protein
VRSANRDLFLDSNLFSRTEGASRDPTLYTTLDHNPNTSLTAAALFGQVRLGHM